MEGKYSLPKDGGLIADAVPRDIIHRFEKIPTSIFRNEREGVCYVADKIVKSIQSYEQSSFVDEAGTVAEPFVLGLTTGGTPIGLYRELVNRYNKGEVSFSNVAVFSIDEFYPVESKDCHSRNYRIHSEFLDLVDIKPENVHLPDGTTPMDKVSAYCEQNSSVISALENGADIIEGYADATVDTVKLMKEKGASLILSISPMLSLARLSQTLTSLDSEKALVARERIKGAVHFARLAILAGMPVGIGSGASLPFVTHYSFFRELYFFSKYCAVSPIDAIKTATLTNASLLGLDGILGSIDKGKTADMVILSSDPAKDITALSKPVAVVRAGDLIDKLSIKKNPESDRLADLLM